MKSLIALQVLFAAVLLWTCFCRLVHTDENTRREVRWAFWFELVCAGLVLGAPFLPLLLPAGQAGWPPGTTPLWCWVAMLFAAALVRVVTAIHWRNGQVPAAFQRNGVMPNRRIGDTLALGLVVMAVASFIAWPQLAVAQAQAPVPDGWRQIDGDMVYMPQDSEMKCGDPKGCVAFTVDGLRALLAKANGTCGRIPSMPEVEPSTKKPGREA